jgi:(p)ppGpp synthase/HD superfamily hydrolase
MATLERAIQIATSAHAGQTDKAGQPYVLHPLRVMDSVTSLQEKMAAILHDVVEDTPITFEDLAEEGFHKDVIDAIRALTKFDCESRIDAAHRAAQNPIARQVKLADVADNMDMSRLPNPTDKDYERLREYEQVRAILRAEGDVL